MGKCLLAVACDIHLDDGAHLGSSLAAHVWPQLCSDPASIAKHRYEKPRANADGDEEDAVLAYNKGEVVPADRIVEAAGFKVRAGLALPSAASPALIPTSCGPAIGPSYASHQQQLRCHVQLHRRWLTKPSVLPVPHRRASTTT